MKAILKSKRPLPALQCTEFKYIANWEYYVLVDNTELATYQSTENSFEQKAQAVLNEELYGHIKEDLLNILGMARDIRPLDYVNAGRLGELEIAIDQALEKMR